MPSLRVICYVSNCIFDFARKETVASLLNHMFDGERAESVIVNGLSVIQTLLEFRKLG